MQFTQAKPNLFYDGWNYYNRLSSENERWQIMLTPVLYGVRVNAGINGEKVFALDVCCGDEEGLVVMIFLIVKTWLEQFDESVSYGEVVRQFPRFQVKPVYKDPLWDDFCNQVFSRLIPIKQ